MAMNKKEKQEMERLRKVESDHVALKSQVGSGIKEIVSHKLDCFGDCGLTGSKFGKKCRTCNDHVACIASESEETASESEETASESEEATSESEESTSESEETTSESEEGTSESEESTSGSEA